MHPELLNRNVLHEHLFTKNENVDPGHIMKFDISELLAKLCWSQTFKSIVISYENLIVVISHLSDYLIIDIIYPLAKS